MMAEYTEMLAWRGVEAPCKKCGGSGVCLYSSTAIWRGGIGGAAMTKAVCDGCWGSGDQSRPWANLREQERRIETLVRENAALKCGKVQ